MNLHGLKRAPRVAGLALLLLFPAVRSRADEKPEPWIEVSTAHFVVASNGNEKDARNLAQQFEQIRNVFQTTLGFKKVDPPEPIVILALKDERSMSKLLPDYWAEKGHVHPAGLFISSQDANYILEQMDSQGENRYHILYHEYTHSIVQLNFPYLPPWLNEGYAEFIGNTTFSGKEILIGQPSPDDVMLLRQSKFLPLDQLFQVTEDSSYYNESNLANIFYAESWALVHLLMLDPNQRKGHPLDRYIQNLATGMNALDAAKAAFGDLGRLQVSLEKYIQQAAYFEMRTKLEEKNPAAEAVPRTMIWGGVEALEGEMECARGKTDLGEPLLEAATKDAPRLASPYVDLGMIRLRAGDHDAALEDFSRAISLDTSNYLAYFYRANLAMSVPGEAGDYSQAISDLEKTVALNPQFAPAFGLLAQLYGRRPETREKALAPAQTAAQLEPGNFGYQLNIAFLYAALDHVDEARALAHKLELAARNDGEENSVQSLEALITHRADYDQRLKDQQESQGGDAGDQTAQRRGAGGASTPSGEQPEIPANTGAYSIGTVASARCAGTELFVVLDVLGEHFNYHANDAGKIAFLDAQGNPDGAHFTCGALRGQRIRLGYQPVQGKDWEGEVLSIRHMK